MKVTVYPVAMRVLLVGWMVACVARPAMADTQNADEVKSAATKDDSSEEYPYLGIAIEPLHPGMASHLPGVLIQGQGVLVRYVTPDSPAAKAGITQHDILVRYADQKLFSAEQLAKLVMADKRGHNVVIELVRGGKLQTVHASLGMHAAGGKSLHASHPWRHEFSLPWFGHRRAAPPTPKDADSSRSWDSFNSLTLTRLDDGKFQAEIKYRDGQGKIEQHVFKGTRDEIDHAVKTEKDLPAGERDHLLNAISHPRHTRALPEFRFDREGDFDFYWQPIHSDF